MHVDDKIAKAMIGDLTRSKDNVVQNPFPEGQELVKVAHDAATHFSYSTRFKKLCEFSNLVSGGAPKTRLQNDKCTTRVSARGNMVRSVIRMHKPLGLYGIAKPETPPAKLTRARFEALAEIDGLMKISSVVCVLDQTEFLLVHALGHPLHDRMLLKYRSSTVDVIDLPKVTASPIMVKKAKNIADFSSVGLEAKRRGTLEVRSRDSSRARLLVRRLVVDAPMFVCLVVDLSCA